MANFVATERPRLQGLLVRRYQQLTGEETNSISLGFLAIGAFWMACFLSFTLACAIGLVAAWPERHREWDIALSCAGRSLGWGSRQIALRVLLVLPVVQRRFRSHSWFVSRPSRHLCC
jgi:hypothetical protein